ncbi:MAG: GNAT family N-acetyltransferase [Candidatus Cloacimonadaceae bacterium]
MQFPFSVKRMLETELRFPQRFTNMVQRNYGLIFFNEGNKRSYDSNHALIFDLIGVESSVRDIESFYKSKGINPRIYGAFLPMELDKLKPSLENNNFTIDFLPDRFYHHDQESSLMPIEGLRIERVRNLTIDVMEAIAMEFGGDYTLRVAERHLHHPSYHLLCGFWEGEMVSLASVGIFAGYSRVDDVYTRTDFRGRGFAGAMLHHLIQYHRQLSTNHLYLYSSSPESIRIYQKAGFSLVNLETPIWEAYKILQPIG